MKKLQNYDISLQIKLFGDSCVGKSAIAYRYVRDEFLQLYTCTVGLDLLLKNIEKHDKIIKLLIWDNMTQGRLNNSLKLNEFKNLNGLGLVYDITNRKSYQNIKIYIDFFIQTRQNNEIVLILIGNKCDLEILREVSYQEGQQLADSLGICFLETSAKSSWNVNMCFQKLVEQILIRL